jgi:uncharacterized protein YpmS
MIIDSNTLGWLIATGIAVYIIFKNWKRFIKLAIFAGAALFVLFVVQIKTFVDSVAQATTETNKNEKQIEIKADYDTLNKTIHIKDVQVKHK